MKYVILVVLAIFSVIVYPADLFAIEFVLFPQQDAWVNEANPDANYGSNTYLSVKDRSGLAESFLKWGSDDLNSFSGLRITSASLFLYQYQGTYSPGDNLNLRKVTSDWNESSITWNSKPGWESLYLSSLNIDSGNNMFRQWPGLEDTLSDWLNGNNYGLALENNTDNLNDQLTARFYSSEYSNPELRPYIKVSAEPQPLSTPEPPGMLFLAIGGTGMALFLALRSKKL